MTQSLFSQSMIAEDSEARRFELNIWLSFSQADLGPTSAQGWFFSFFQMVLNFFCEGLCSWRAVENSYGGYFWNCFFGNIAFPLASAWTVIYMLVEILELPSKWWVGPVVFGATFTHRYVCAPTTFLGTCSCRRKPDSRLEAGRENHGPNSVIRVLVLVLCLGLSGLDITPRKRHFKNSI